jgi:hypothetical protein
MAEAQLLENRYAGPGLGGLFHSAAFHKLHAGEQGVFFEWEVDGEVLANIHFTAMGSGHWRSPARGTFAGYAWRDTLGLGGLQAFHKAVMMRMSTLGARRMEVLTAPMAHDPQAFSLQTYLLRSSGFQVSRCDLNQSLLVDARTLSQRMSYGNLKRLRKCEREGLLTQELPHSALPDVYDTLVANRTAKGHTLSMTLTGLQQMVDTHPDAVRLFGCQAGPAMAAAALCLRLSEQLLYVFYWGDRPGYAQLSPTVALADVIYAHCQADDICQMDVGTSTVDIEPNLGLLQFKRGLGFTESLKLQFSLDMP